MRRVSHSAEACAATSTLGRMALAMPELEQQASARRATFADVEREGLSRLRGRGAGPTSLRGPDVKSSEALTVSLS